MPAGQGRNYVIACSPRTGSTWLGDLLRSTGVAGVPDESLQPAARRRLAAGMALWDYPESRRAAATTPNGVCGMAVKWNQLRWLVGVLRVRSGAAAAPSPAELFDGFLPGARWVFLRREDTARQAVSWHRAALTGNWFDRSAPGRSAAAEAADPLPDAALLDLRRIRWLEDLAVLHNTWWDEWFQKAGVQPLRLSYEQLAADPPGTVGRVLEWIGVPAPAAMAGPSMLRRQADATSETVLSAYLERRDSLQPSPWLARHYDPRTP